MDTNRNNSGLEAGGTGYNPGRDPGQNVRSGPMDQGPGRGAEGGGGVGPGPNAGNLQKPVQAAKQFVNEGKRVAKDIGQEVGHHAKDIAHEVTQELRGSADQYLEQGRERVSGQVGSLASALHRVSDEMRQDQGGEQVARMTSMIAEKLDSVGDMIQNREPREILRGMENFARREPALFLGGCLLAGVVISRFLKASSHRGDDRHGDDWGSRAPHADSSGNFGSSAPMDVNVPRGPLDRSGLGSSATPFDVTPRTPETPPELGGV
jgi:hypothetical protein